LRQMMRNSPDHALAVGPVGWLVFGRSSSKLSEHGDTLASPQAVKNPDDPNAPLQIDKTSDRCVWESIRKLCVSNTRIIEGPSTDPCALSPAISHRKIQRSAPPPTDMSGNAAVSLLFGWRWVGSCTALSASTISDLPPRNPQSESSNDLPLLEHLDKDVIHQASSPPSPDRRNLSLPGQVDASDIAERSGWAGDA
jgi:hypothetical protein